MNTQEKNLITEGLKRGDALTIAKAFGVDKSYVNKVLSGSRGRNTLKAKLIIKAYEEMQKAYLSAEKKLQKMKSELELEGE